MVPSAPRVCVAVSPRLLADVLLRALREADLDVTVPDVTVVGAPDVPDVPAVGGAFAVAVGTPDLVRTISAESSIELPGSPDGVGDVIVHDWGGDRALVIGSLAELRDLVVTLAQH